MRNPIYNLGDYNKVRIDLQTVGGRLESLYKNVGETAVAKAAPKLLLKGCLIGMGITVGIFGAAYGGYKGYCLLKDRKQKIKNEPALKKEFSEALEAEIKSNTDS